jgi:iron-sulfur cluster repair protein YtfE (RIC family)
MSVPAIDCPESELVERLNALREGEEVIVSLKQQPAGLAEHFLDGARGRYDFSPVERGPSKWSYHVIARPASRQRTVMAYLAWDHDRLDELLKHAMHAATRHNWPECRRALESFRHGLFRHILIEDDILFPVFESKTGMRDVGPTAVMRAEHLEIKQAVEEMMAASRAENLEALERWHANLLGVLVEHNMKEEQVLYPTMDHLLPDDERDELVRRMLLA